MLRSLIAVTALLIVGCVEGSPTPSATQTLLPHARPSASATHGPARPVAPLETAGPSPTPLMHVIVEGDTLLSIAIQYGVELPDLLLANPGVNPRLLVIGNSLNIPRSGAQGSVPTATPVAVGLSEVTCYEVIPDGLTCLLMVEARGEIAVEGVVALVTLVDSEGHALHTEPAYGPANLVLPGGDLPLIAQFADPDPSFNHASAVIISALSAGDITARYADVDLELSETEIAPSKLSARIAGTAELLNRSTDRNVGLRLVIVALDRGGGIVGYRTWEAPTEGSSYEFEVTVFSLGPPIDAIDIISEAAYLP